MVLTHSGQVGAAMEGALYRMRDGYIRMHAWRYAHSLARLVLGKVNERPILPLH